MVATLVGSMSLALVAESPAQSGRRFRFYRSEKCFMHKINHVRTRHGQNRLDWDKQLAYVARRHANLMAERVAVWHDPYAGERVTRWRALAQNTGRGHRCRTLFRSFMASPSHRANVLGHYRFIGVGVSWRYHRMYVQQLFEWRRDPGNIWHWP